jgi:hypothetical protein
VEAMTKKSKFLEPLAVQVAGGQSIKAGAESVGCSIQTAYNLSATDGFRQRVAELRCEITAQAVGTLTTAASQAATTLVELLDATQEPSIRLQACKAILATVGPISELGELRRRLDELEHRQ